MIISVFEQKDLNWLSEGLRDKGGCLGLSKLPSTCPEELFEEKILLFYPKFVFFCARFFIENFSTVWGKVFLRFVKTALFVSMRATKPFKNISGTSSEFFLFLVNCFWQICQNCNYVSLGAICRKKVNVFKTILRHWSKVFRPSRDLFSGRVVKNAFTCQ